ncbi:MAG: hypothetical protein ACRYG8_30585, partial [Janthinobacterium lividum]
RFRSFLGRVRHPAWRPESGDVQPSRVSRAETDSTGLTVINSGEPYFTRTASKEVPIHYSAKEQAPGA